MSRLCRLKNKSHGDDGQWAYDEIVMLRKRLELAIEALKSCGVNDGLNGPAQYFDEELVERAIKGRVK